jgi:hypothetical protein
MNYIIIILFFFFLLFLFLFLQNPNIVLFQPVIYKNVRIIDEVTIESFLNELKERSFVFDQKDYYPWNNNQSLYKKN